MKLSSFFLSILCALLLKSACFASFSSNVNGNIINTVDLSAGNIESLSILTTSIESVLFDEYYELQLLGQGGSGNYEWSISSGALPDGFSLNAETGVLSGNFNYLTLETVESYDFTLQLSDQCFPATDSDNNIYYLDNATQDLSLGIDTESYCWNLFESGSFQTAQNRYNNDFAFVFFEGTGIDIYFGTENVNLDLPSSITVDNVEVTPVSYTGDARDPSLWVSTEGTDFERYTLASGLDYGDHVMKIVAPTSGNKTIVFQGFEVEQISSSNQIYYINQGIIPENTLYRCGSQRTDLLPLSIDPELAILQTSLAISDLPGGNLNITTDSTTTTDNTTTADNLTTTDNTTVSDNVTTATNTTAKPRLASSTDSFTAFLEVYDENSNRIDTIFKNSNGTIHLPGNGTRVKLVYLNEDDPRDRYESVEEPIETVISKALENPESDSSLSSTTSSSSSSSSGGGGGGGCLLK